MLFVVFLVGIAFFLDGKDRLLSGCLSFSIFTCTLLQGDNLSCSKTNMETVFPLAVIGMGT